MQQNLLCQFLRLLVQTEHGEIAGKVSFNTCSSCFFVAFPIMHPFASFIDLSSSFLLKVSVVRKISPFSCLFLLVFFSELAPKQVRVNSVK